MVYREGCGLIRWCRAVEKISHKFSRIPQIRGPVLSVLCLSAGIVAYLFGAMITPLGQIEELYSVSIRGICGLFVLTIVGLDAQTRKDAWLTIQFRSSLAHTISSHLLIETFRIRIRRNFDRRDS